jgi:hypothetical protein
MGHFVRSFGKIRNVEFSGEITAGKIQNDNKSELRVMREISLNRGLELITLKSLQLPWQT